jgi:AraC-like DNA-binding protein
MEQAVEQVINVMRTRYSERLYVPELAAEAFFSPFHFSRIFRRETGVAPGQYLTAVRLFEAKRLLLTTSTNVADIACQVGYRGIGTFTTRFSAAVGASPGLYRRMPREAMLCLSDEGCRIPDPDLLPEDGGSYPGGAGGTVVAFPHGGGGWRRLFVGVFDSGVPQGRPLAWRVVGGPACAPVRLDRVPAGRKVVIAVAERDSAAGADRPDSYVFVGPLETRAGATAHVELRLRRPRRTDPPILVALSDRMLVPQRLAV